MEGLYVWVALGALVIGGAIVMFVRTNGVSASARRAERFGEIMENDNLLRGVADRPDANRPSAGG